VGSEQANHQRGFSGRLIICEKGVELPLPPDQPELVIGRTDPVQNIYPDVDLAEQDGEKSGVSRRHARILQRPDGVYIEDLNSTNFTILNRIRLQPGRTYPLKDGDEIRLGVLTLEYRS
jgi:pSer/pThr/pTyr-binding forkhead associated (FHA) protein